MKKMLSKIVSTTMATAILVTSFSVITPAATLNEAGGWNESVYAEWTDSNPTNAKVEYKLSSSSTYIQADSQLIRKYGTVARVDIPGVKAGAYDIKITASDNSVITKNNIEVTAYDRSGYAHFNYTAGVGAYNDDGTIKSNAKVIYVTEATKDTVTLTVGSKTATGIGNILNSGSSSHNGILKALSDSNTPLVVRVVGKVTNPSGTTAYNSSGNGGSTGDNGHMARMKSSKNVTIEGIGYDAKLYDWGIHFVGSKGYGIGFEVRNLTFESYPEDAIGMEGLQSGDTITEPVQRCWIHNNTFLPGYCANPAEDDKAEGDGSCDFKRGTNYTLSYNYFVDCHKTNLVGSSDDCLQFDITMHHNWWKNCASRSPLARQANIHVYNNYYDGSTSKTIDARANSYIFAESNFLEKCNNPITTVSGAVVKSLNNTLYSCTGSNNGTVVTSRETTVANNNTNSTTFDTDSTKFYYDSVNKKSNVTRLTSPIVAKSEVIAYSGAMKEVIVEPIETSIITKTPANYVSLPYTKNFISGKNSADIKSNVTTTENDVLYTLSKDQKATATTAATIKAEAIVFKVSQSSVITIDGVSGTYVPVLYNSFGDILITGSGSATVPSGTYMIQSSVPEKEAKINGFSIAASGVVTETTTQNTTASTTTTVKATETTTASTTATTTATTTVKTTETTTQSTTESTETTTESSSAGSYVWNYTAGINTNNFFNISANDYTSGSITYNGATLTKAIKMETSTSIKFTAASDGTLKIVTLSTNGSPKITIDGVNYDVSSNGEVSINLSAGSHEITKNTTSTYVYYLQFD